MRYVALPVSESGSFGPPEIPVDCIYCRNRTGIESALDEWEAVHRRVGSAESDAELWIWYGYDINDPDNLYPDLIAYHGTRGGFHLVQV